MSLKIILLFALFASFGSIISGKCPTNPELIEPCICQFGTNFSCNENANYDLKRIFEYTTKTVQWFDRKHPYLRLDISNTELTELDESTFFHINFEEIVINNAEKLTKIHSNAFGSSRMSLKRLTINNANLLTNSLPNHNIFDVLSSLNNIEMIAMNGINVTEIPDYAFRPILGHQWNLKHISIYGPIQRIGNYAFYDYPYWLRNITIGTKVNFISAHAFDMRWTSMERLVIDLSDNELTENSFESGVFMDSKRPLFVDLSRNHLRYLDESIFSGFFSKDVMNQIDLDGNPLECDCHMKWLLNDNNRVNKQVLNAVCNDGKALFAHTLQEVSDCTIYD